ncbi:hypothetical protein ACFLYO_04685 [Chloroflexota bacterium]
MEQRYSFSSDTDAKLFEFKMWGLWTPEEFEVFNQEFMAEVDHLSEECGNFYVLADVSEFPPQRGSVTEKLKGGMKYAFGKGLLKTARIVGPKLGELQLQRLSKQVDDPSRFGYFETREAALEWLNE